MADLPNDVKIPQPDSSGVEPTQGEPKNTLIVVPPESEQKGYGSVSTVLEAFYTAGIRATAMPLLLVNQQQAEKRYTQVDNERLAALRRIEELNAENTTLKISLEKHRGRLAAQPRIAEQVMTTVGAAALGVGIPAASLPITTFGVVLLLLGWGMAIMSIRRNKNEAN